jgi:SAM-dependent methyltransferase
MMRSDAEGSRAPLGAHELGGQRLDPALGGPPSGPTVPPGPPTDPATGGSASISGLAQALGPATFDADYFATNYRNYPAQNPDRKLGFYLRLLTARLDPAAPLPVLDVGCGPGAWLTFLARHTRWQLHGTDLSAWAVEHVRQALPGVTVRSASATDAPFPPASFDAITACDVIEHVPDREAAARAIAGMLRPGGWFLFVVPVYDGLSGPLIRRLDRDPTHVHKLPRADWLRWASRHFELVDWLGTLRYLLPGSLYLHLPTRWGRHHTPAIAVLCRRPPEG